MPAIVERDHAVAGLGENLDPARRDPVDVMGRGEAVDEEDRLRRPRFVTAMRRLPVDERDLEPVMDEA